MTYEPYSKLVGDRVKKVKGHVTIYTKDYSAG